VSLRVVRAVGTAERSDALHLGRLLILLRAAGGQEGTRPVAGITKLAKMDFLLRYPNGLARVLRATGRDAASADIKPHERDSIETKMVRFRYGPWDARYRRWIGLLVARGLGSTYVSGRTVYVRLTDRGREIADQLGELEDFGDLRRRGQLVTKVVGQMSATRLKDFIYEQFPELLDMQWGVEIEV
jgi:hypothetical protein